MPFKCQSNLYCTPSSLGERHCCNTGQKWDSEEKVCTESDNCDFYQGIEKSENRLINAIRSIFTTSFKKQQVLAQQTITAKKQKIREFASGSIVGCESGEVCCGANLGDGIHYECMSEDQCVKSY